ncbi:winged helix-turn-helix transcriptional regulator [Microbulbifer spongiae]|uniref:Helix-turn-helix transcriptional regulator n=1 Tax=Microbulbifer spongiae TaxID=2944933 RepID=A0ABY9EGD5_9GAMM|nr:helix-turn-helix domain-containing protein [Microbulbifer sp. MI-G]WKD51521.1 helix-turn-helix transcriptional regulator [Microbulbifer sp. MI-G]
MQAAHQILSNPVARGLNLLGDRWTILILREIFLGQHRFEAFRSRTGASRGTLSKRLETLVQQGVLYRNPYQTAPLRYEYRLTGKGLALYPWALLVWQWETEWSGIKSSDLPVTLRHKVGRGHSLNPLAVCRHCGVKLRYDDVERVVKTSPESRAVKKLTGFGGSRRSRNTGQPQLLGHVVDIIGDRWTLLLMAMAFVGLRRYDDFHQQLGAATNILADRLKLLVKADIFARCAYQNNPPRYEYHLTTKGKALYPLTMALRQWVLEWLPKVKHPLTLMHKPCGHELATDVICQTCNAVPKAGEVEIG